MSERQPIYEGDARHEDILPSTDSSLRTPGAKPSPLKTEKKSFVRKVYARWKQIFGGYSLAIMVFGTLVILGASAVLLYLWLRTYFGSRADQDSPGLFRLIVQYSAAPQVVTICAAAIRTCISLQLALLTAALASVMIEQSGVPLAEAAALSLKRASGAGLFEFLSISEQKRLWRKPRGPMIGALTFVAGLLSLVTAFASTILLSDFSDQAVAGVSKTMLAGVEPLYPYFQMGKGSDWKMATPATWRFGMVDNAKLENGSTAAEVTGDDRDTGDLIVAMLPFTEAERRRSLLRYEGPAAVSNLRTFCYAPKDDDVLGLSIVKDETTGSGLSINGSLMLWPESNMLDSLLYDSRLMLNENGHHKPVYFHCPLLMDLDVGPQAQKQSSYVGMCPTNITWGLHFRTSPTVVLNMTNLSALETIYDEDPGKWNLKSQRASDNSVWTTVTERAGQDNAKQPSPLLDLSVCITYAGATTRSVVMRGKALDDEPTAIPARRGQDDPDSPRRLADGSLDVYEDNTFSPDYQGEAPYGWDTAKLSDQLHGKRPDGIHLSITERDLLEILDFGETWAIRNFKMDVLGSEMLEQGEVDILPSPSRGMLIRNVTYPATYYGDLDQPDFTPHMIFSSEFLDVWANTESLPSAMQTLMLRLWQTHYATYVLSSNNTYNVNATFATTTLLPVRWTGLSIVLGMVVIHLIVGAIATAMFVRYVQGSKLWHPWQAVAQLYTPETTELIEVAKDANEKDLKKWVDELEGSKEFYMVTQARATGRYELQNARHRKDFEGRVTVT